MASWTLTVRLLSLPTRRTLVAAHDVHPEPSRLLSVVELENPNGDRGWGECSALNRVGYAPESAGSSFDVLSTAPELSAPEGGQELINRFPMAMAALEMAELDLRLKQRDVSLADYLGVPRSLVPAGAVLPLADLDQSMRQATLMADLGFRRMKLKIVPSIRSGVLPKDLVRAVRSCAPTTEIHVDANGSFDAASFAEVAELAAEGVAVIEQPFSPSQVGLAADLVATGVTVAADESATDLAAIQELVRMGACSAVVVKPARLGGLYGAFELLAWCEENGVAASAGGMLESGLGRHALAVVAANQACTLIGDISPSRQWLLRDPWPDIEMEDGFVRVPSSPGVAPEPDFELLMEFTTRSVRRSLKSS
ncbi:MAG: hypothetical protein HKN03_04630 [Acidimicrobiales bacterium]|nr:hypothetical protein [Acidimicrobiales bacterium]